MTPPDPFFFGDDDGAGFINSVKSDGSAYNWYDSVNGDVRSSPVIDSSNVVYFGDNGGYFHAFDSTCGTLTGCGSKWSNPSYPGAGYDIKCTPALSPDEATVYYVSTQTQYLYALNTSDGTFKWQYDILGNSSSSPTVDPVDGTIYVGSDGSTGTGNLFAINPDGTLKWRYDFNSDKAKSRPAIGADGTIYIGNDDDYLHAITDDETQGTLKWRYQTSGNVKGSPTVHDDGTIWFGSDDHYLYVVDSDGLLIDKYDLADQVQSSPTQGADGAMYVGSKDNNLYAYKPTCNPQNIKSRVFSYDDLLAGEAIEDAGDIADSDNWLNSGPWAVRVEVERSETANSRGLYEYTLKTWIRQCQQTDCADVTATYFADTRIEYGAKDPHLTQTAELCSTEHSKFDTFLYGFTQATGGATQTAVISDLNLGFIREGDFVITSDADW